MYRTVFDWIRLSLEQQAGLLPDPVPTRSLAHCQAVAWATEPDGLLVWCLAGAGWIRDWTPTVAPDTLATLARNRRCIGVLRYESDGPLPPALAVYPHRAMRCLRAYHGSPNLEYLVDCYNYLLLEWHRPGRPRLPPTEQGIVPLDYTPEDLITLYQATGLSDHLVQAIMSVLRLWLAQDGFFCTRDHT